MDTVPGDSDHVQLVTVFSASIPEEANLVDETCNQTETTLTETNINNHRETTINGTETGIEKIEGEIAESKLNSDPIVDATDFAEAENSPISDDRETNEQTDSQIHTDTLV